MVPLKALILAAVIATTTSAAHRAEGLVVEVEAAQGLVVVAHGPVKGYMPAMTMPFRVSRASDLTGLTPGTRIRFQLTGSRIHDIVVVQAGFGEGVQIPQPANILRIGDLVPNFELTDQESRTVRLSDSHGSVTVINFVYTRCPMPGVCPRQAANFAYLARKLPRIRLLTITLDAQYDTPEVLHAYAARFNGNLGNWHFLTGPESRIREVGGLFGLVFWPEEGVITHTSSTAVVGPEGKLRALVQGTSYRVDQLLAVVSTVN